MNKISPLSQFHKGVAFEDISLIIPWHITQPDFLDLVPRDKITSANSDWICGDFTLFGIAATYAFNFIAFPDPLFHEVQVCDSDPRTLAITFLRFAESIKQSLGEPTREFKKHVRWHDRFIVVDLSIRDVRSLPDGPQFPLFQFSLANTTRWAEHWNNDPSRPPGME